MSDLESILIFLFMIFYYVFFGFCLQKLAKRTNTQGSWMAWFPILNLVLIFSIAGKESQILLIFVPLVNLIVLINVWAEIAEQQNKSTFWGFLMLVPLFNLFVIYDLAFR